MRILMLAAIAAVVAATPADARSTSVRGYFKRSTGTYVAPYHRTSPNRTRTDNWSSRPNVNPYTGTRGTKDPYAPKKRY